MFKFDLQLFADGEAVPESTAEPTVSETPTESTDSTPSASTTENASQSVKDDILADIRIGTDGKGNKTLIVDNDPFGIKTTETEQTVEKEPVEQVEEQQEQAEPPQVEPQVPQYYANMDELVMASSLGVLDESKVSPEQRQVLMNLAMQRQMEQQRIAQQADLQAQKENERRAKMLELSKDARLSALKELNITEEDLANADFMENGSELKSKFEEKFYTLAMQKQEEFLRKELTEEIKRETASAEHRASMREINAFIQGENMNEPHFKEILEAMDTDKMNLPYGQASKIFQAEQNLREGHCTANDLAVIREYYDYCKKSIYQKKAGVSKIPQRTNVPKVENTSHSNSPEQPPKFDFSQLRRMTSADRSRAMVDYISSIM